MSFYDVIHSVTPTHITEMGLYGFFTGVDSARRIPGKMQAYLKKNNPGHLQLLLDKHVLGEQRN